MAKTWCVGGRNYSESINQNVYEKLNPKLKSSLKLSKELVFFVDKTNHKFLLSKLQEEKFL